MHSTVAASILIVFWIILSIFIGVWLRLDVGLIIVLPFFAAGVGLTFAAWLAERIAHRGQPKSRRYHVTN